MYKQYWLKCETYFQCKKKKKKMSFTWKVFMECNKAQWFGENNSLWKSFSSLAKKLMSRIWDMSISKLMKYFKVLRHIKKTVGFFFLSFHCPVLQTEICVHSLRHTFIFVKKWSCSPFSSVTAICFFSVPYVFWN